MSSSTKYHLLHKGVQKWLWEMQWTELRDLQELAIEPILKADRDVIISASTASGKTEAAFLPACSKIAENNSSGVGILYISPLKALINDQFRRLERLCEILNISLTPWHGDSSQSQKNKLRNNPNGILLITPESLESLLMNNTPWCIKAFSSLEYIIIDEFHAFIGTERGSQLQSLMHRLEFLVKKVIPRIALSATLNNLELVKDFLRPSLRRLPVETEIILSNVANSDLQVQIRGYLNKSLSSENELSETSVFTHIASDIFDLLRGKSNLIFANSRNRTEELSAKLSELCFKEGLPNEFFPHHGSLAREIREDVEQKLQEGTFPVSAVCTMTLELGIDIGNVDSIAQVTAPFSVSSLRQRLGRSGRRDKAAILRMFIEEEEIDSNTNIVDRLRLETVQCIAMLNLLLKKWYEPPEKELFFFSTFIQQILSIITQYGGVRAEQLWNILCKNGTYKLIEKNMLIDVLKSLGNCDVITQMEDGLLTLGTRGEKIVGHYSFYTAFNTPEEYRLEADGKILGTLPIDKPLVVKQIIIFAGKRWEVVSIDPERRVISLKKSKGGKAPSFSGECGMLHDRVREEMYSIFCKQEIPTYLNKQAKENIAEAFYNFTNLDLKTSNYVCIGSSVYLFPWKGDKVCLTICLLLQAKGLQANSFSGIIEINKTSLDEVQKVLKDILSSALPTHENLAEKVPNTILEKYDFFVPENLRNKAFGRKFFDIESAVISMKSFLDGVDEIDKSV